jgi:hypothetical protein
MEKFVLKLHNFVILLAPAISRVSTWVKMMLFLPFGIPQGGFVLALSKKSWSQNCKTFSFAAARIS